ncbi:DUF4249 domain-containing protein [Hymenobacter latericus]|uniref:DUF4249 domain-containing protein n=1 Tax=Hymenobacter sp. YIM 151858-1 TaxID=2987688 RepID=UPI00222697B8|nr:DUF4249 domain-containing protein [Hymenobacter sp. YIM 151858-1]UYZ60970.1 DUF4249 domain-containing protein [Hymenobacter sp. YIM 151858-1]
MPLPSTASALRLLGPTLTLVAAGCLSGCGLQKDVDVELPAPPAQLVAECYLESGQIPQLTITETVPYLSEPSNQLLTDVTVTLTGPTGRIDTLRFGPGQNAGTKKFFTHRGRRRLTIRPGDTYRLDVKDTKGRHLFGTSTMPATVPIDTIEWKFNDRTGEQRKAYVLTKFDDPAATVDFYRLQVHRRRINDNPAVDYLPEDRLLNGQRFVLGTSYEFSPNDTLFVTLFHLERPYYDFLRSIDDAQSANGNPFGQPAKVRSTVEGGIGVFTILNYQRRRIILKE